jgi:hypothetical protein
VAMLVGHLIYGATLGLLAGGCTQPQRSAS